MAELQLNSILNLILIIIEFIIIIGFIVIYIRRRNAVLKPLIWSIGLFLASNIFSFFFYLTYDGILNWSIVTIIIAHLLIGGGLILQVYYLEMFESEEPYTKRSAIATILIIFTGILQLISNFIQGSIGLLVPIPYVITGIMYLIFIKKIKTRAKISSQKKKIGKVQSGIFMIYVAPLIIYFSLGVLLLIGLILTPQEEFSAYLDKKPDTLNIGSIDPIVMLCQLIGIVLMSVPVFVSQSPHFMQSRKISRLTVINDSGLPIYDFNFEPDLAGNELLLGGALTAIKSVMTEATGASRDLKCIVFGDLHIITEVREGFAVNLIVENSNAYLKESLRLFTEEFASLYDIKQDSVIIDPDLHKEADKLLQTIFGIEDEEMEEILELHNALTATKSSAV